MTSGGTILGRP